MRTQYIDLEPGHEDDEADNPCVLAFAALRDDMFLSGSGDGALRCWRIPAEGAPVCLSSAKAHEGYIDAILVLKNGLILSAGCHGWVTLWRFDAEGMGTILYRCQADETGKGVYCLKELPNGYVITGSEGGQMKCWQINALNEIVCVATLDQFDSASILALEIVQDQWLVSGNGNGAIRIWQIGPLGELQFKQTYQAHDNRLSILKTLPNGLLIGAGFEEKIHCWELNAATGELFLVNEIVQPGHCIQALDIHSDGAMVSVGTEGGILIWSGNVASMVFPRKIVQSTVHSILLILSSDRYLTASLDKITLWGKDVPFYTFPSFVAPVSSPAPAVSSSSSSSSFFQASSSTLTTDAEPILSHEDLMKKMQEALRVDRKEVYVGTAMEQSLVGLAGISTEQTDASFRRQNDSECFRLRFANAAEYQRFLQYYCTHFPELMKETDEYSSGQLLKIKVDVNILANQVLSKISELSSESNPVITSVPLPAVSSSSSSSSFFQASSFAVVPEIVSTELSHEDLMKRIQKTFRVSREEVYVGTTMEQSLVGLAGISTEQRGASFRRENDTERFKLRFANEAEHETFLQHYSTHFPGFIKEAGEYCSGQLSVVKVDVAILTQQVLPKISESRRAVLQP